MILSLSHKTDNTLNISFSSVINLTTINVESKSRITIHIHPTSHFILSRHIDSCNYELRIALLELSSQFFIIGSESSAVSARRRVVLNEHEFVVLQSVIIGLVCQLYHINIFNFRRLMVFFSFFSPMELLNIASGNVLQELSQ